MRVTYDREAKALYIYTMSDEDRKKKAIYNHGTDLDEPAEGINTDWCQGKRDLHCYVSGIEVLNVELEDITAGRVDLPEVSKMWSK